MGWKRCDKGETEIKAGRNQEARAKNTSRKQKADGGGFIQATRQQERNNPASPPSLIYLLLCGCQRARRHLLVFRGARGLVALGGARALQLLDAAGVSDGQMRGWRVSRETKRDK